MSSAPSAAEQDGINGRQSLSRRSRTEEEVEIKSSGGERGGGGHQPYRSSSSDSSAEHVPGPTIHNDGQFIAIERIRTEQDEPTREGRIHPQRTTTNASGAGPVYSVFSKNQKRFIVFIASWAGFFSPVSGQIYFPALVPLARDLHVSDSLINLTLTSYMVRNPHLCGPTGMTE